MPTFCRTCRCFSVGSTPATGPPTFLPPVFGRRTIWSCSTLIFSHSNISSSKSSLLAVWSPFCCRYLNIGDVISEFLIRRICRKVGRELTHMGSEWSGADTRSDGPYRRFRNPPGVAEGMPCPRGALPLPRPRCRTAPELDCQRLPRIPEQNSRLGQEIIPECRDLGVSLEKEKVLPGDSATTIPA